MQNVHFQQWKNYETWKEIRKYGPYTGEKTSIESVPKEAQILIY